MKQASCIESGHEMFSFTFVIWVSSSQYRHQVATFYKEVRNLSEHRTAMKKLSAFTLLYIQRIGKNIEQNWEYKQFVAELEVSNSLWRRCLLIFFKRASESLWFHKMLLDSTADLCTLSCLLNILFKNIRHEFIFTLYFVDYFITWKDIHFLVWGLSVYIFNLLECYKYTNLGWYLELKLTIIELNTH